MTHADDGGFTRPAITGSPAEGKDEGQTRDLGTDWVLEGSQVRS